MADIGQADLEDSNMANYGGKDHRDAMKKAAQSEKEFVGAGQKVGLEIWRVENRRTENDTPDFGVKRWPKEEYGQFYDGDSYIVLNTYIPPDAETGKPKKDGSLAWDVHFWLGKDTSIDERGVAAYKTVELDDLLDDGPVQHRETMGNESPLFQSYFKTLGLTYLSGGIESGFRKVKPEEYEPRLLHIRRAKRSTKATQVECSIKAMNQGDCFILDTGRKLYKYMGPSASPFEKSYVAHMIHNLKESRLGKSRVVNINDDEDFWQIVGGSESEVPSADEGNKKLADADRRVDKKEVKMFRISDASGKLTFTAIDQADENGYLMSQLDSDDVFVVDTQVLIFIWRGKGATKQEKSKAWKLVDQYINENNISNTVPVTVLDEGKISTVFKNAFVNSKKK